MTGKLASGAVLAGRLWRNGLWGLAVIVVAMVVGIAGYMYFGEMELPQAFANAAMILSGMGPLDNLSKTSVYVFEGIYALVCGLIFFAVAGLVLAPLLHRMLHRFHIEDRN
jgi:NhaP-type Na+/H+ or K+/H+ antiporter